MNNDKLCTQTREELDHAWKIIQEEIKPLAEGSDDPMLQAIERLALVVYRVGNGTVHQIAASQK